ncbi:hypothetical protein BDZ94DRAFT_1260035 [Collybia nuda]|uniref:Uncharacterized protein n=1 Tax=Collybia nuda TaxID=64659 RepID=A0A9P6CI96_9AGAR|nr:hypothetical protein BDZ94DRAFT_1260035 [Collybia nuda]
MGHDVASTIDFRNSRRPLWLNNTSTLSFSTFTSSNGSTNTTSTTSTVPGPGAMSGKAILALGKATLRGAEYIIIRSRLQVIASKLPCEDTAYVAGIEEIYDDVLELSRRGLYSDTIRTKAMAIILSQIRTRHTQRLIKCLIKWPSVELQIFLSYLTATLDPFRLVPFGRSSPARVYREAIADRECHSMSALIDFLLELTQETGADRAAILKSGIMDLLLHMYVSDFYDPLVENEHGDFYRKSTIFSRCNIFLREISAIERELNIIRGHPLYLLWPAQPDLPFQTPLHDRMAQRARAWNLVMPEVALWRIQSVLDMMLAGTASSSEDDLLELATDILELSGSENIGLNISIRALRALSALLFYGKISGKDAIRQYLASSYYNYPVEAMARIIIRLSRLITFDTPEWEIFHLPWDENTLYLKNSENERHFEQQQILHITNALIGAAKFDRRCFEIMTKANIVGLLRPYLELELRGTSRMMQHGQEGIIVYDPSDFKLLESIRDNGPRSLISPPPDSPTFTEILRRIVVCRGFDVFLSRKYQENSQDRLPELWRINQSSVPTPYITNFDEMEKK